MKNIKLTIIIIAILIIGGYFWFVPKNGSEEIGRIEPIEKTEVVSKTDEAILAFADIYKANKEIPIAFRYSYQFEEFLVKTEKPIILTARLNDIFRKDGKIFSQFTPTLGDRRSLHIFYTLSGCEEKLLQMGREKKEIKDELFGEYVVVAKISNVTKPTIKLKASAISEDEAEINLSGANTFIATGSCIDFEYINGDDVVNPWDDN